MNNKLIQDDATHETEVTKLPEWARWKGEGPAPAKWWATDPRTNESVLVYRSYADYAGD